MLIYITGLEPQWTSGAASTDKVWNYRLVMHRLLFTIIVNYFCSYDGTINVIDSGIINGITNYNVVSSLGLGVFKDYTVLWKNGGIIDSGAFEFSR